jgi:hypothetical protein
MSNTIKGEIVVASRIIDYLSSGLYESPAACLKELINNAYDADATRVELFVKPDANRIIVADDGHGMDSKEFVRNFSKISESFKRESSDTTASSRPKIGKIGIGFIAANEICDVMQIISTRKGSTEKIDVEINFAKMREPVEKRRRANSDFAKADFTGRVTKAEKDEHYTHIFLKEIRGPAQELLVGARLSGGDESLYGLNPAAIATKLSSEPRSWEQFDFYSRTMLEIALNVPVEYAPNWAGQRHTQELAEFTSQAKSLNFSVFLDGTQLLKPTVFPDASSALVRKFEYTGQDVSFKSYFYVQHGVLKPQDINGVLIRIRNSAVGRYDRAFLGYPSSLGTLFQRWVSAEIWADDRLEAAMNIDRKTLRVTHPAYLEAVDAFHEQLKYVLNDAREHLYETPARGAKATKAKAEGVAIRSLMSPLVSISDDEVKVLRANSRADHQVLLRKFSTSELLSLVLEVASEVMDKRAMRKFLTRLLWAVLKK